MPDTKYGTCPWCEKEQILFFTLAKSGDELWADWVCATCLQEARRLAAMVPEQTEPSE